MTTQNALIGLLGATLIACIGCLPKDTRPPPSLVHVTASPSEATQSGVFTTLDGWTITLSRALISIGRTELDGDKCTGYSDAEYTRVLSLIGAPAEQKLSDNYALGHCSFGYAVTNPNADSVLGVGVTETDKGLLLERGFDLTERSRTTLLLEGVAEKSGKRKQFSWRFGGRARFGDCKLGDQEGLDLREGGEAEVDISIHAEAVFRRNLEDGNEDLQFDAIAAADDESIWGDHDGIVTLDELSLMGLALLDAGTLTTDDPAAANWVSVAEFVTLGAAATVPRYQGTGQCTLGSSNRRGPP